MPVCVHSAGEAGILLCCTGRGEAGRRHEGESTMDERVSQEPGLTGQGLACFDTILARFAPMVILLVSDIFST